MNEAASKSEARSQSSSLSIEACCRFTEAAGVPRVEPLLDKGLSSSEGKGTSAAAVIPSSSWIFPSLAVILGESIFMRRSQSLFLLPFLPHSRGTLREGSDNPLLRLPKLLCEGIAGCVSLLGATRSRFSKVNPPLGRIRAFLKACGLRPSLRTRSWFISCIMRRPKESSVSSSSSASYGELLDPDKEPYPRNSTFTEMRSSVLAVILVAWVCLGRGILADSGLKGSYGRLDPIGGECETTRGV